MGSYGFLHRFFNCLFLFIFSVSIVQCGSGGSSRRGTRVDSGYATGTAPATKWRPTAKHSIPVTHNPRVQAWVNSFDGNLKKYFVKWVKRIGHYGPTIETILQEEGVPRDLIYLAMIESGFNLSAYSSAAATGPWQFIASTGRMYDLESTPVYDERRDLVEATRAAARHLRDLYKMYGDWYLAFAAYNAGPGKVNRAIKATGSRDYWRLAASPHLRQETKDYVPKILAALHIVKNYKDFGYTEQSFGQPMQYERVFVNGSSDIDQLAKMARTDLETFKQMNPAILGEKLPAGKFAVYIPKGTKNGFDKKGKSEPAYAVAEPKKEKRSWFGKKKKAESQVFASAHSLGKNYRPTSGVAYIIHKNAMNPESAEDQDAIELPKMVAKKTEKLDYINSNKPGFVKTAETSLVVARQDPNFLSEEKRVNRDLPSRLQRPTSTTVIAQKNTPSKIFKEEVVASVLKDESENNAEIDQNETASQPSVKVAVAPKIKQPSVALQTTKYRVKKGDTLGLIASRHGVKLADLKKWNGLKSNNIRLNQNLLVKQTVQKTIPETQLAAQKKSTVVAKSTVAKSTKAVTAHSLKHVVAKGDTLSGIASKYKVSLQDLQEWNGLNSSRVMLGQRLVIQGESSSSAQQLAQKKSTKPIVQAKATIATPKTSSHRVRSNETLTQIAARYKVSPAQLSQWNGIKNGKIYAGQNLILKSSSARVETKTQLAKNTPSTKNAGKNPRTRVLYHKVRKGETLWAVAKQYRVTVSDLKKWNSLNTNTVQHNQKIKVIAMADNKSQRYASVQ